MASPKAVAAGVASLVEADPAFAAVVAAAGPCDLRRGRPHREHFAELSRAICYQQLAGRAAAAIHARFEACFVGLPTPEAVLALDPETLRGCGLSAAKTASICDLAGQVVSGSVRLDVLGRLTDDDVVRELTRVRGVGPWTAHMFLIAQLGRLDVWPTGDLGVRRGWARIHGLEEEPTPRVLEALGEGVRPHRSIAAWYCWRAADEALPVAL